MDRGGFVLPLLLFGPSLLVSPLLRAPPLSTGAPMWSSGREDLSHHAILRSPLHTYGGHPSLLVFVLVMLVVFACALLPGSHSSAREIWIPVRCALNFLLQLIVMDCLCNHVRIHPLNSFVEPPVGRRDYRLFGKCSGFNSLTFETFAGSQRCFNRKAGRSGCFNDLTVLSLFGLVYQFPSGFWCYFGAAVCNFERRLVVFTDPLLRAMLRLTLFSPRLMVNLLLNLFRLHPAAFCSRRQCCMFYSAGLKMIYSYGTAGVVFHWLPFLIDSCPLGVYNCHHSSHANQHVYPVLGSCSCMLFVFCNCNKLHVCCFVLLLVVCSYCILAIASNYVLADYVLADFQWNE